MGEKLIRWFLVVAGDDALLRATEGQSRIRNVVIEFDSLELAVACYNSPEYQRARAHREGAAEAELMVVEGIG